MSRSEIDEAISEEGLHLSVNWLFDLFSVGVFLNQGFLNKINA